MNAVKTRRLAPPAAWHCPQSWPPPWMMSAPVVVSTTDVPRVVSTDPDDDHVIAAAITGQADLIGSGDKRDLLPMGSFQGIPIITAREAVERLEARSKA